jgi:hypothetical protein
LEQLRIAWRCKGKARSKPMRKKQTVEIKRAEAPTICGANKTMLVSSINHLSG